MSVRGIGIVLIGALLSAWSLALGAETVYVIDTLAVGLHEDRQLDSPIIKVIPTGTPLEVLATEDNLVQVRTDEGVVGWVDATYVMQEKPAQLALLELEASYAEAQNQLQAARDELLVLSERVAQLEATRSEQDSTGAVTTETLRDIERLAEDNKVLKGQLAEARAAQAAAERAAAAREARPKAPPPVASRGYIGLSTWHWIMIGALMVLSFGFGGYMVDLGVRRRHGGFRV